MRWGIPFIIEDNWYDEVQQELLNKLNEHITLEVIMTPEQNAALLAQQAQQALVAQQQAPVVPVAQPLAQPVQTAPLAAPVAQPVQVQPAPVAQVPVAQTPPAEAAPVAGVPVAPSWDDVNEGGGGVDIPTGTYFGTLVHVAWADSVDDYDKNNPKPYKGIKFVFSVDVMVGDKMEKALISTGYGYLKQSLSTKGKLRPILAALIGGTEVSLDALKAQDVVTFYTEKLGTILQLGVVRAASKAGGKEYSNISTYSPAVVPDPNAPGGMSLMPKVVDFAGITIPDFNFKDTTYTVSIAPAPTVA